MGLPSVLHRVDIIVMTTLVAVLPFGEFSTSFLNGPFYKKSSSGLRLKMYETQGGFRSCTQCAATCVSTPLKGPFCMAFSCNSSGMTCDFYTISTTKLPSPGIKIYVLQVQDTFHTISLEGRLYSVYVSSKKLNYINARIACNTMGAYLLEFDSLEEYDAVWLIGSKQSSKYSFVGAYKNENDGQWVTDRQGTPLDLSLWLFQDRDAKTLDDTDQCAFILHRHSVLSAHRSCFKAYTFVCERDL